ncbi:tRNA-guanine transglycosylase [Halobacterium salinarum]|uniref:tRNA-guanine transglycosylase n=1 Tax=Halospeciosus flavus TaxID=3032283 RepID=A0ABD5YWP6_9EURY|nr:MULTISPECIES: tRNA-guanine transglycosylase [Halobacteriaceae]MDL0118545.1 tRNA-guanine transglycosylase [Halobacterium salinarum]MDL0119167.1 tRNA-guanine transglycosylase [Halobacterium salinarum]MDL0119794.1 tRNA-guanine transglycosylase [Halobacterium salinarum]
MLYRRRELDLPHGTIETPVLFPVRNIGKRSSDNTPTYVGTIPEFSAAMINARSIRNRDPMWNRLTDNITLREEMDVPQNTIVFADSGGFDFSSEEVDTTPAETLETQRQLDADIFGTVDVPISRENRDAENQERIDRSIRYALEASDRHDGDELLLASVHGYDPETLRNSIQHLERNGEFDGYALGSLVPIRTDYKKVTKLILAARNATDKHLHVYGLGGLVYQPLLLYLGVDSFDSSAFIRSAGNRNYLIPGFGGEELRNIEDLERLPCPCPVCGTRTLADIREDREALTQHNLWALATELRRFKYVASSDRDIEEYLDLRFRGNEVTQRAYKTAKQQMRRLT